MSKIRVIIKHPGRKPYVTHISDTLQNLQQTVGGYIETVTLSRDCVIICNEEGRLLGLPYNCCIGGIDFVGTIIFAGRREDELADFQFSFADFKCLFKFLFKEAIDA